MRIYSKRAGENRLFHFARSEIAPYRTLFDMAYVLCEFRNTEEHCQGGKRNIWEVREETPLFFITNKI